MRAGDLLPACACAFHSFRVISLRTSSRARSTPPRGPPFVGLSQDGDHLLFAESRLLHGSLVTPRAPFSQLRMVQKPASRSHGLRRTSGFRTVRMAGTIRSVRAGRKGGEPGRSDGMDPNSRHSRLSTGALSRGSRSITFPARQPDQNAYIERFNRSSRTEVRDAHLFESIAELRVVIDGWLEVYNCVSYCPTRLCA